MTSLPGPAPSIMRPMIEVPETDWPSFRTVTCASNLAVHWTNLAEARACRPLVFTILRRRSSASPATGQFLRGDANIFAARFLRAINGIHQLGGDANAG